MRFLHLADLHLGKVLHGVSLIDQGDQVAWVDSFLSLCSQVMPRAVCIAGDVYDRAIPSREAIALFNRLLTSLHDLSIPALVVTGNHDSGPRLHFASDLLSKQGIHIAGTLTKELRCVTLFDDDGPVHFTLMPYLFPAAVEDVLGVEGLYTYDAAARALLSQQSVDTTQRNVLVAHQLVLASGLSPEMGGSEATVGGVGQIDASAFSQFDYVALGHIHKAQPMGASTIRYAGSPMCYHFSEIGHPKGCTLVEMGKKGSPVTVRQIELPSLHPLIQRQGTLSQILQEESLHPTQNAYVRIVLTDSALPQGAVDTLRALYRSQGSSLLETVRDSAAVQKESVAGASAVKEQPLAELFSSFFEMRTGALPDGQFQRLIDFAAQQVEHFSEDTTDAQKSESVQRFLLHAMKGGEEL